MLKEGLWEETETGTPQGAVISPLLELHPDKTRLLEFGRFAAENRCQRGRFVIWRQTANERMVAKLKQIKQKLRRRMHAPLDQIGAWLQSVWRGFYQYHAVPGNLRAMNTFRHRLCRLWRNSMRHRSQRHKINWDRLGPLFAHWLPQPQPHFP